MNGTVLLGGGAAANNPGPSWHAIGAGDFNGDGKADILWQNDDGQAAICLMNGILVSGSGLVGNNPGRLGTLKAPGTRSNCMHHWFAAAIGSLVFAGSMAVIWYFNDAICEGQIRLLKERWYRTQMRITSLVLAVMGLVFAAIFLVAGIRR